MRVITTRGGMDMDYIARFKKLVIAEDGQDLLEYALLVALIALVAVAAVTTAGVQVNSIFGKVATQLTSAAS
jgi:pilus assembly protein Flp/PilA